MKNTSKMFIDNITDNNIEDNNTQDNNIEDNKKTEKVFLNKINNYPKIEEYKRIYHSEKTNDEVISLLNRNSEMEYYYYLYSYLDEIRNIKLPEISKQKYYNAVLIEFKIIPHIEFVIRNNINILGELWCYTVVCGNENYDMMYGICNLISKNINLIKTNINEEYGEDYNNMLLNVLFWKCLSGDKILIYNRNSLVLGNSINNFVKYDYVGNELINMRTKSVMIDILIKNEEIENSERIEKYKKLYNLTRCPDFIYVKKMINNKAPNDITNLFISKHKFYSNNFSINKIWLKTDDWKKYIYSNIFNKNIKKKYEVSNISKYDNFEIILLNGKIKDVDIDKNIIVNNYKDDLEYINYKNYLFINGSYDITFNQIKNLYDHFNDCCCNILSPIILKNNTLEYFGAVINNEGCIINIDESILKYQHVIAKLPVYSYVQNTMFCYPNIYIIKNINNILETERFKKEDFVKKSYIYSKKLNNVKFDPFVIINNINDVSNKKLVKINYNNELFPFSINYEYLKDMFNNYTKFNLISFKFYNDMYYLTTNKQKTILLIEETIITPDRDCGSLYIYYMLVTFLKMGFNVHFLPTNFYCDEKYTRILQKMGIYVCYVYPYSISYHLKNNYNVYDYIFVCRLFSMEQSYDYIKEYCKKSKIIFVTHDLNFLREERKIKIKNENYENKISNSNLNNFANNKEKELKYIQSADITIVVSKEEHSILKNENLTNVYYIPICYDLLIDYDRNIEMTNDVYFIGSRHPPNLDAVEFFINEHWKKIRENMDIKFHIIGSGYEELVHKYSKDTSIIFHGFVSDELLPIMIKKFRLNIVPLRFGAGIKGKILQSSNLKIPCISSNIGVEGMEMEHLKNIIVSEFDDMFYIEFKKYYNDVKLLKKISDNSYDIIKKYYSLDKNEDYFRNIFYVLDGVFK